MAENIELQARRYNEWKVMEHKLKDTPPRLPIVFQRYDPPLYLVTFNTLRRRPWLACDAVHHHFANMPNVDLLFTLPLDTTF